LSLMSRVFRRLFFFLAVSLFLTIMTRSLRFFSSAFLASSDSDEEDASFFALRFFALAFVSTFFLPLVPFLTVFGSTFFFFFFAGSSSLDDESDELELEELELDRAFFGFVGLSAGFRFRFDSSILRKSGFRSFALFLPSVSLPVDSPSFFSFRSFFFLSASESVFGFASDLGFRSSFGFWSALSFGSTFVFASTFGFGSVLDLESVLGF